MENNLLISLLVIFAALGTATWHLFIKSSKDRLQFAALMVIPQFALALPFAWNNMPEARLTWLLLAISAVIHTLYVIYLSKSYRRNQLSLIYPLAVGSAPLFSLAMFHIWQGLDLSHLEFIGVIVLCLGLISFTLFDKAFYRQFNCRLLVDALVIALLISCFALVDTFGIRSANAASYISWLFLIKALLLFIPMVIVKKITLTSLKFNYQDYLVAGLLAGISYSIAVFAFSVSNTAVVLSLRSMAVLFTVILAGVILKEYVGRRRLYLSTIIVFGMCLILAG